MTTFHHIKSPSSSMVSVPGNYPDVAGSVPVDSKHHPGTFSGLMCDVTDLTVTAV